MVLVEFVNNILITYKSNFLPPNFLQGICCNFNASSSSW